MRFLYEYRTSDNAKHNGVICAADREAAYAELKKRGVKPSRFAEAPGFFNKLFGKGKRWMVIGVLGAGCLVLGAMVVSSRKAVKTQTGGQQATVATLPRHQIANIPKDWPSFIAVVFADEVDRTLALYSQPGVIVAKPCDGKRREITEADLKWTEVLRQVVAGMREDANGFLKLGKSVDDLSRFLEERQRMEANYREQLIRQLNTHIVTKEDANTSLSAMGLELIK